MKKIGETPWDFYSVNTCICHGRVFNFSSDSGKLRITELILGDDVRYRSVTIEAGCQTEYDWHVACCSLGQHILVMAGEGGNVFAALVDIDGGQLSESKIHMTELIVEGDDDWIYWPFLCSVSESRALLYFDEGYSLRYCDIKDQVVTMRKFSTYMSADGEFRTLPLCLPDGKLLVAGKYPCSRSITLISGDAKPQFERIGEIPGRWRYRVSTVLLGERFVIGFGGKNKTPLDDLWIFDIKTRKGSPVTKKEAWHQPDYSATLAVQDNALYLVGGWYTTSVHCISLQALSELIVDVTFQSTFQTVLGLRLRQYPAGEHEDHTPLGMYDLGGYFPDCRSHNVIARQKRLFHLSSAQGRLCVTEILVGRWIKTRTINTGVECGAVESRYISCCSFGEKILVFGGKADESEVFCALVSIGPGELTKESVQIERKQVSEWKTYTRAILPVQISEDRVWVSFPGSCGIWIGEIKGDKLVMTKHQDLLPTYEGLGMPPLQLSDGRVLMAGKRLRSVDLIFATPGEQFFFEKAGALPRKDEFNASTILVGKRFVVGFGGGMSQPMNSMWIFDIQTRKSSWVKKEGEWHPQSQWPVLFEHNRTLYVIGGGETSSAHCLSFLELSRLTERSEIRSAFCFHVGLSIRPITGLRRSTLIYYTPTCL